MAGVAARYTLVPDLRRNEMRLRAQLFCLSKCTLLANTCSVAHGIALHGVTWHCTAWHHMALHGNARSE
eukprot:481480-Lingulodinium_polyedra.AAC.1